MNLHALLSKRAAQRKPLRVLLIGTGKFGSMYIRFILNALVTPNYYQYKSLEQA